MNDLSGMTTPVLQDWWEHYVCPACMSKHRDSELCSNRWHSIPAVTYECSGSAFSPLSIPVSELRQSGQLGSRAVVRYGLVWTRSAAHARPPSALGFV